jgi:hypothetical protein
VTEPTLPFSTRLWFCFVALFRVLFDGAFAARVHALSHAEPALRLPDETQPAPRAAAPAREREPDDSAALELLSLLQREGRLIDFVQQDIVSFSDADVGAAARVVHEGCRRALSGHAEFSAVRGEAEGSKIVLEAGFDAASVKLTGDVRGAPPYRGTLRHRGWRVERLKLPERIGDRDARVVAPAEIEL